MKQLKNIILIFAITILLSLLFTYPAYAQSDNINNINTNAVKTKSASCILIEAKTGKILYSKNGDSKMYPASTTKLMTAILTSENCDLSDKVTISKNAVDSIPEGYTTANLQKGEILSVEQLMYALLIPSANDAAVALAEHISGSVKDFSTLMNNKAQELGCKTTHFVNPNGIHNKNHYSSAYDMALIGKYALNFPEIRKIVTTKKYTLPATNKYDKKDRILNATNALINKDSPNHYKYATGLKTGYTDDAGNCLVASAKKDNLELIAVILNADSSDARFSDCKTLFNYGFENYLYKTLNKSNEILQNITIENATEETKNLDIVIKDEVSVFVNNKTNIEPEIYIQPDLKAPIVANSKIGTITYKVDDVDYSSDLIAGTAVYPVTNGFEVMVFRILLIFLILYILYILLKHINKNDKFKTFNKKGKRFSNNKNAKKSRFKFTQISDYL